MNKNIIPLILIILISVSCTDDEKRFVEMIDFTKKAKAELVENATFPNLDLDNLSFLKIYSDSVSKGDLLFGEVLKSKKSIKRIKKYLLNDTDLSLLCDSLFLEEVSFLELKSQCSEGYFNICPRSFSDYKSNALEVVKKIKGLIGEDIFSSSDCNNFIKEEV